MKMLWPEIGKTPELPKGRIILGQVSVHLDFRVHSHCEQWEMTWVYIPAHTCIQNTHHKYIHTHKALFMEHLIEKIKCTNKSHNAKGRFLCAPNFTPQMPHLPPINSQSDVSQWEFVSPPGWRGLSFNWGLCPARPTGSPQRTLISVWSLLNALGLSGHDWQEEVAWPQNNEQVALARAAFMTVFLGVRLPLCEFSVTTGDWFSYSKKHQNL